MLSLLSLCVPESSWPWLFLLPCFSGEALAWGQIPHWSTRVVPLKLRTIFFSSSQNSASLITPDARAVIILGFWLCLLLIQIMSGTQNAMSLLPLISLFPLNNNNRITTHGALTMCRKQWWVLYRSYLNLVSPPLQLSPCSKPPSSLTWTTAKAP